MPEDYQPFNPGRKWGIRRLYWRPKVFAIIDAERRQGFDPEDTEEL